MGAVLRISMMRRLWYAQIISVFGDFLALFAVISILTFKLHANAQQITGVQISYMLPIAVLGIIAGVFVDRWPLKPTMVSSDSIRAGLVLLLIFARQPWHFYAILAAISVVSSFFSPAQGVAIRSAVPLHGLRSANALMQQVMFGMRIIGPAIAAFMVVTFGAVSCYVADSASFVGSALLIASVPSSKPERLKPGPPTPRSPNAEGHSALGRVWLDMKQGISFIVHHAGSALRHPRHGCGHVRHRMLRPAHRRLRPRLTPRLHQILRRQLRDDRSSACCSASTASTPSARTLTNTILVYSGLFGIAIGLCCPHDA